MSGRGVLKVDLKRGDIRVYPASFLGSDFFRFKDITRTYNCTFVSIGGSKYNSVPICKARSLVEDLQKHFEVEVDSEVLRLLDSHEEQTEREVSALRKVLEETDRALRARGMFLRPCQKEDAIKLYDKRVFMLCNPVGTGKSVTVLHSVPPDYTVIIISPAGVRRNWLDEIKKWRPEASVTLKETTQKRYELNEGGYTIYGYSTLPPEGAVGGLSLPVGRVALFIDEFHYVKNGKAKRTKKTKALIDAVKAAQGMVVGMTATPLLNRCTELYSLLSLLGLVGVTFGNWKGFAREFDGRRGRYGWEFGAPSAAVPGILAHAMIKRKREDIIAELPKYTHQIVRVSTPKSTYTEIAKAIDLEGIRKWVEDNYPNLQGEEKDIAVSDRRDYLIGKMLDDGKATDFDVLSRCRTALSTAKVGAVIDELQTYIDAEESVVVCTASSRAAQSLWERLPKDKARLITGGVKGPDRADIISQFQEASFPVLVVTIGSCMTGIDLTRASHMVFIDQTFVPAENEQMRGRIDRLSQKSKALTYKYILTEHPIDELIHNKLMRKKDLIDATFG